MCADYRGSNARVIDSPQNEDDASIEDEIDSDQSNIKTEKVSEKCSFLQSSSRFIR